MCNKVRYQTRSWAKKMLVQAHGAKTGMSIYRCNICGSWHYGHASASQKKWWRAHA